MMTLYIFSVLVNAFAAAAWIGFLLNLLKRQAPLWMWYVILFVILAHFLLISSSISQLYYLTI